MATAVDLELKKAFTELQAKVIDTQQKVKLADLQIEQLNRTKKHAHLTDTEIKNLPDETPMYEGVGRMFVLQTKEKVQSQLLHKQKIADDKIAEIEVYRLGPDFRKLVKQQYRVKYIETQEPLSSNRRMPSCIVQGCTSSSKKNDPNISLHVFPSQQHKIRKWLVQTGQFKDNLESMVQTVQYGKVNDLYRMCSLHFTIQDYNYTEDRRRLKADAFPTLFNSLTWTCEANPNPCSTTVTTTTCTVSYTACSTIMTTTTSTTNYTSTQSSRMSSGHLLPSMADPVLLPPPKKIKTHHLTKLTGTTDSIGSNTTQCTETNSLPFSRQNQASSSNTLKCGLTKPPPYVFVKKVEKGINTDHFIRKRNFAVNTDHHRNRRNIQTQTLIQKKHRKIQCNLTLDLAPAIDPEATVSIIEPENWACESTTEDDEDHRTSGLCSTHHDYTMKEIHFRDREDVMPNFFTGDGKISTSTPFKGKKSNSEPSCFLKEHDYTSFSWLDEGSFDCVPQNQQGIPLSPIEQSIFPLPVPDSNDVPDSVEISLDPSFFSFEKTGATLTDPSDDTFHISRCNEDSDDTVISSCEDEIENKNNFEDLETECSHHAKEEKFVVFECQLRKLLMMVKCQSKKNCQGNLVAFKKCYIGSMVSVKVKCSNGHEKKIWDSQPKHKNQPLGNVLIASAVLLSGLSFQKTRLLFDILKLRCIGQTTFFKNQRKYLFPAIDTQWKKEQTAVLEELKNKTLCLIGDGQCDSPGYSAKYCIYTLMDYESKKIVSFSVEQIIPPLTAVSLEKIAFERNVDYLINSGVEINIIATDRHISVRKIMREKYKSIKHQFDVWHMAKSVGSKVLAASKKKESTILSNWIQPIKNHLWWCSRTCGGDGEQLVTKWKSLLHHVVNVHEWCSPDSYNSCLHPPIVQHTEENTKWLLPKSPTFNTLQAIVENKNLICDIRQLNYFCHTGELENYHSVCLKYRPKRIHYFYDGMLARSQLAALDHNHNVKRSLAVIKKAISSGDPVGTNRHRLEFSKARKSWVIKALYAPTSHEFLTEIIEEVMRIVREETVPTWRSARLDLPANIASVPKPNKTEMVRQHESRF